MFLNTQMIVGAIKKFRLRSVFLLCYYCDEKLREKIFFYLVLSLNLNEVEAKIFFLYEINKIQLFYHFKCFVFI